MAPSLKTLSAEINERDKQITAQLDELLEANWIRSLLDAGDVLAPSSLTCLGRDPDLPPFLVQWLRQDSTVLYSIEHWHMWSDAASLATQFGKACRFHMAEAAMGPVVIIIHPPTLYYIFCLIDMQEQFAIEKLATHSAVERLYVPVLARTARLYE